MAYISNSPSIKSVEYTFMNQEEEEEIRDSKEVRRSVEGARNGDLELKKQNFTRLVNGTSLSSDAIRKDQYLISNGMLLLDFDVKDDPENKYQIVESRFRSHIEDWGVVHMEESARGGAHIMVRMIEGLTPKQMLFLFQERTGLTIDHNGLNVGKACFLVPNEMVHYVNPKYYYSTEPVPPVPLDENDRKFIEYNDREEERKHLEEVKARMAKAETFNNSSSDSETLISLVKKIEQSGVDIIRTYDRWVNVGFIIGNILGATGAEQFLTLSLLFNHYSREDAIEKYFSLLRDSRHELGIGTLIMYAREEGVIK